MFTRKAFIQLAASSMANSASHAQWQGIAAQNAAFDAQFNARLGAMQQQNARYQQAIWQNHLKVTARVCVRNTPRCAPRVAPTSRSSNLRIGT